MASRLYVGGLSYQTSEDELRAFFEQVGTVTSVTIPVERESGRSRGFGFVEMSTNAEADRAVEELNGQELTGRTLRVDRARAREERPDQGRRGRGPRQGGGGGRRW